MESAVEKNKIGFFRLVGLAIGGTIGGGVFSLSGDMAAKGVHTGAILLGWAICGIGMLGLVMCFYWLNQAKPELTGGISSYASEGFGKFIGFNSAWGYWISAIFSNVSFITFMFASLGFFFPIFEKGNNLPALIGGSVIIWLVTLLISQGIRDASGINAFVTFSKIIPIFVFILAVLCYHAFNMDIFMQNFWGAPGSAPLLDQIKATSSTTIWTFIGIEGAVVTSGRAARSKDVGYATVSSFLSVLAIYVMVSGLSMGVLPQEELAALGNPPLAGIMEHVVGPWGALLINAAVIFSVAGAFLGYTIVSVDCAYAAGTQGVFNKFFTGTNKNDAPSNSLLLTNTIVQLFLIILFFNSSTYQIFYFFAASMIMVPYFFCALYFTKICFSNTEIYANGFTPSFLAKLSGIVGSLYGCWLMYASGPKGMLSSAILYAIGIIFYHTAMKENHIAPWGRSIDTVLAIGIVIAAITAVYLICIGTIDPFS